MSSQHTFTHYPVKTRQQDKKKVPLVLSVGGYERSSCNSAALAFFDSHVAAETWEGPEPSGGRLAEEKASERWDTNL